MKKIIMKSNIREAINIFKNITLIKQNNITKLWDHYVVCTHHQHGTSTEQQQH